MASIMVKAGDDMPLHLQLGDFETGKYPRAILRDDDGVFIKNVDLVDRGDGLYTAKEPMPSSNTFATYKVFEDAGYSVEDTERNADVDIFILDTFEPQRRDDKIVGVIDQENGIEATVEHASLEAAIEDVPIIGEIEDAELEIVIRDDPITGIIERC
jgi:hypothetical protein